MFKKLHREKLRSAPLAPEWRQILDAHFPFYQRLTEPDRQELEGHVQVFMAEKVFEGCGGLTLTDEVKLSIASGACLLLLHRDTNYYPGLKAILVYPTAYVAPATEYIGGGIFGDTVQARSGESWRQGAVVLAWDVICQDSLAPAKGHNVILHEFAHQLDTEDGLADGVPILGQGESWSTRERRYADWKRVMLAEYQKLCAQVKIGQTTVLRAYGATNPAEFFAVVTECFFCKPGDMRQSHPELYEELKWFYQQNPADWPQR
jgi:Mlc titration factor MtfA (ptsG expression regulator)